MLTKQKSFLPLAFFLPLLINSIIANAMELPNDDFDQEISQIEKALRCLGIKDNPIIITNATRQFAQQMLAQMYDIKHFEDLNPDQKIKFADIFLDQTQAIKKGDESLMLDRSEIVIKLAITLLEKLTQQSQNTVTQETLNKCIENLKRLLSHPNEIGATQTLTSLNSYYDLMDEGDQEYYSMLCRFSGSHSLGKEVYKALLVEALNQTNKDLRLHYQDYSMMDLIHLWRSTCGQELSIIQKILMALTRVENPTFSNLVRGNEPVVLCAGFFTFVVSMTMGLLITILIHTTQDMSMEPWGLIKEPLIVAACMAGAMMILLMGRNCTYYWINKRIN